MRGQTARRAMKTTDRRSGHERRAAARQPVTVDVEWETLDGRWHGTLGDLSTTGCFVLSSGDVSEGDLVRVYLPLGDGMKVEVLGEVKNHVVEIGFGLRFVEPTEAQLHVITGLMEGEKG